VVGKVSEDILRDIPMLVEKQFGVVPPLERKFSYTFFIKRIVIFSDFDVFCIHKLRL